jgi:hypothetical protein
VKANIHFPVDWVLLRDGVKSLMQSVELIRTHGLRSRMCEPQVFIAKINRLSMEMAQNQHQVARGARARGKRHVPPGILVGHDALDKFAGDLRATHPHFAYAPHASPQALHNAGCLKWGSGPRGGVPTGLSTFAEHGRKSTSRPERG